VHRSRIGRSLLGLGLAVATSMAIAPAAERASGEAKVEVRVAPTIVVSVPTAYRFLGKIGAGPQGRVCAVISFNVQANTPAVRLQVGATHLYKGGSVAGPIVPLLANEPPDVISDCTQVGSPDNVLPWSAEAYSSRGLAGLVTETREFVCGGETFNSDVDVKVCWQNDNPLLPPGGYVGYVKLRAEVAPP
jgi:hypothetical protein